MPDFLPAVDYTLLAALRRRRKSDIAHQNQRPSEGDGRPSHHQPETRQERMELQFTSSAVHFPRSAPAAHPNSSSQVKLPKVTDPRDLFVSGAQIAPWSTQTRVPRVWRGPQAVIGNNRWGEGVLSNTGTIEEQIHSRREAQRLQVPMAPHCRAVTHEAGPGGDVGAIHAHPPAWDSSSLWTPADRVGHSTEFTRWRQEKRGIGRREHVLISIASGRSNAANTARQNTGRLPSLTGTLRKPGSGAGKKEAVEVSQSGAGDEDGSEPQCDGSGSQSDGEDESERQSDGEDESECQSDGGDGSERQSEGEDESEHVHVQEQASAREEKATHVEQPDSALANTGRKSPLDLGDLMVEPVSTGPGQRTVDLCGNVAMPTKQAKVCPECHRFRDDKTRPNQKRRVVGPPSGRCPPILGQRRSGKKNGRHPHTGSNKVKVVTEEEKEKQKRKERKVERERRQALRTRQRQEIYAINGIMGKADDGHFESILLFRTGKLPSSHARCAQSAAEPDRAEGNTDSS